MTVRKPRIAIFGDSHYAALRLAHREGLVELSGIEVEYWGHVGKRFRFLSCRDGAIVPDDDVTAQRFAKFNEKGRTFLAAADFDAIFFVSCRVDVTLLFQTLLAARRSGPFLTSGLQQRMCSDGLRGQRFYTYARDLAAAGGARILLAPVSFPTEGYAGLRPAPPPKVRAATLEDRAAIWAMLSATARADGLTLLPQPDETVAEGLFTRLDYAVENHLALNDHAHKNAAYGALIYSQLLAALGAPKESA